MNDREKLNIQLSKVSILKARIHIAKDNHNVKELNILNGEFEKWNDLIDKVSKEKPNYAYLLNEYYLNNKPLKDIAVDLKMVYASVCNLNVMARDYLLDTGLWKEI